MGSDDNRPIIVGVADIVNRSKRVEDAREPLSLMLDAINAALEDTGLGSNNQKTLQNAIGSIDVVATWTWPYPDLPGSIATALGIKPAQKRQSHHGGDSPAKMVDESARRIATGKSKVAIVTGGEALASLAACAAAGKMPPPGWTPVEKDVTEVFSPTTRELAPDLGSRHGLGNPIHIYPLYENAFRAHRNQSITANNEESAELYAQFAEVAAKQEYSWNSGKPALSKDAIGTVSKKNRMICFPYPLLMNAFNTVNLAAAVILTSIGYAREMGISEEKWIYPLGGAGTAEPEHFWDRGEFWWNPAISRSLDAAISISDVKPEEIDLFDFYSCFPIVPKLACHYLGIPITDPPKPITLLGGLTSFGGAGNNYSMHAITEMTRQLRRGQGKTGLVLANGGVLSYQHVVCLAKHPRPSSGSFYPEANCLPPVLDRAYPVTVAEQAAGPAVVETYTVEFNRDGTPKIGFVIGRLRENGHRFIANHADQETLHELSSTTIEPIGRSGQVKTLPDGRNVFNFDSFGSKL